MFANGGGCAPPNPRLFFITMQAGFQENRTINKELHVVVMAFLSHHTGCLLDPEIKSAKIVHGTTAGRHMQPASCGNNRTWGPTKRTKQQKRTEMKLHPFHTSHSLLTLKLEGGTPSFL